MRLRHGRIELELHQRARRDGLPLLLLHALYGSSADWGEAVAVWPGSIYALDFCGHGHSDWLTGGGYCPELLVGDADAALAHIGRAAVAGAGLGAYVALLLAGTRPADVPAALLLPGAGLDGSGATPDFSRRFPTHLIGVEPPASAARHDPLVCANEMSVRPIAYAQAFAETARRLLLFEDGAPRPPWWDAARQSPVAEVFSGDLDAALRRLALASRSDECAPPPLRRMER